ncbi:MAG: hypothetical protein JW844_06535 [Candidatus Omnitrophica bacterium]|nr:hypothetical protein [Candidatus Omnitrophota bacterium]
MFQSKFLLGVVVGFLMLGVIVGGFYGCGLAQEKQPAAPAEEPAEVPQPVAPPQVTPGDIVYQFADATEMQEFERLYAAKMAVNSRIAVLANYIAMERNNLDQIDAQIYLKYKFNLDPNKMYNLDRQSMVIAEVAPPPAQEEPQQ